MEAMSKETKDAKASVKAQYSSSVKAEVKSLQPAKP